MEVCGSLPVERNVEHLCLLLSCWELDKNIEAILISGCLIYCKAPSKLDLFSTETGDNINYMEVEMQHKNTHKQCNVSNIWIEFPKTASEFTDRAETGNEWMLPYVSETVMHHPQTRQDKKNVYHLHPFYFNPSDLLFLSLGSKESCVHAGSIIRSHVPRANTHTHHRWQEVPTQPPLITAMQSVQQRWRSQWVNICGSFANRPRSDEYTHSYPQPERSKQTFIPRGNVHLWSFQKCNTQCQREVGYISSL